jgi:23S rRNA (cytidine2498-2'-O)-methyltransferase
MTWIWTTRPGFAGDLCEELGGGARADGPAVVFSETARLPEPWPVYARAGFPIAYDGPPAPDRLRLELELLLTERFPKKPWLLVAWVPDSDAQNPLAPRAQALGDKLLAELETARPDLTLRRAGSADAARYGGVLVQLALLGPGRAVLGALPAADAPSLRPGGRARASMPGDAPSRAARKLAEAFEWIGRGPEPGETCVDLGAAPGGWTAVLLARRARVLAVDPARLAPDLAKRKGLVHVQASAFDFEPDEPVDWLLCDMAWRPLEVAALLAKWGRRRWATTLVANIKLPMKQRVTFVRKVLEAVRSGGWQDVRARQLYHDRDEITLAGWRT